MTRKTRTTYFDPVFDYWKAIATLQIWEVAAMMRGFDPRVMTDVTDAQGDHLDLSYEIRMLTSAVTTGVLPAVPPGTTANAQTEVPTANLVPWLRDHGFGSLANGLTRSPTSGGATRWTPEFIDEVRSYRDTHGTKAAADRFGVSTALIRKKLPRSSVAPKVFDVFGQHKKLP